MADLKQHIPCESKTNCKADDLTNNSKGLYCMNCGAIIDLKTGKIRNGSEKNEQRNNKPNKPIRLCNENAYFHR
jgi:Fe2+ or Zn2+ uptake regulation protein